MSNTKEKGAAFLERARRAGPLPTSILAVPATAEIAREGLMISTYVASALSEAHVARLLVRSISAAGLRVVSRWHDAVTPGQCDPTDPHTRWGVLTDNLADLRRADVVVAYTATGTPRATFAEIGYALCLALPVVWLIGPGGEGRCLFTAHPLVREVVLGGSPADAVAAVVAAVREVGQ